MKKKSEPIVFFGSGPVAAASLRSIQKVFEIEAVITKSSTRDEMKAVLSKKCPVYCVSNRNNLDDLIVSKNFSSQVGIIVDFGIILSKTVINFFSKGIVNSHFSLLPEWRGADPIVFAILSGQSKTGVSLMLVSEKLDEGSLLAQKEVRIAPDSSTPSLTDALVKASNEMLTELVPKYLAGEIKPFSQSSVGISYSRKLNKQDGVIDWAKPAKQIEREIRAFIDWPKSHTTLGSVEVVITKARTLSGIVKSPGTIEVVNNKNLLVHCGKDYLYIESLKPTGKTEMSVQSFLAGYKNRIINV